MRAINHANLPPRQLDALLKMAGQKLGRDPQQLKDQLESGQLDQLTQGMNAQQKQQLGSLMSDPGAMNRFLENPQIRQVLEQLMKGK